MVTEGFEQWSDIGRNFTTPFTDVNKVFAEITQRNLHQVAEMGAEIFSSTAKQLEKVSEAKKLEDYLAIQREFVNENIALLTDNLQKSINLSLKNFEELNKMFNLHQEKMKESRSSKSQDRN